MPILKQIQLHTHCAEDILVIRLQPPFLLVSFTFRRVASIATPLEPLYSTRQVIKQQVTYELPWVVFLQLFA